MPGEKTQGWQIVKTDSESKSLRRGCESVVIPNVTLRHCGISLFSQRTNVKKCDAPCGTQSSQDGESTGSLCSGDPFVNVENSILTLKMMGPQPRLPFSFMG